nr:zinc finger, CCHC-type [Tanacetum cinerariifolium]
MEYYTRDEVSDQHIYFFNVEDDPMTFDEAMKSQDIFKRKLKVDGTIKKFKARLVIKGFRQKSWIDYFDTYAPVARISAIRLLIAMASIHNMIIHHMDVKTPFLNGELEEDVYMNQPRGFIMPGNENKVCKLVKFLYGLKHALKQWHQKFDEVVLSNGYLLNKANKYVYRKFDKTGKGVIICLYVNDMLIFGTDQVQVDMIKEFLSSRFSMNDMGEVDVILGIRIKHESNRIAILQSHYIEKVLKKFNYFDCTPVSTPMDTSEKLMPNNGQAVSQLEYSRVIDCLMYAMTCTRHDIAFVMGKLGRLTYTSYPSVLEGYTGVTAIEEAKDLATLPFDVLFGNLKVYEIILENDGVVSKTTTKDKVKSLALKAKVTMEQTSDDSDSQGGSNEDVDEEEEVEAFNLMARSFRKGNWFERGNQFGNGGNRFGKGRGNSFGNKGGESLNDSKDGNKHQNDATFLMKIDSQEVVSKPSRSNNDLNIVDLQKKNEELLKFKKDFTKTFEKLLKEKRFIENKNSKLSSKINNLETEVKKLENDKEFDPKSYEGVFLGYSQTSKAYKVLNKETIRTDESLNVTFDESLPEPKSSSSVEDDRIDEPIVQDLNGSPSLQVNALEEGYPKSVKEAKGHPIEQVIGELNEIKLRKIRRICACTSQETMKTYTPYPEDLYTAYSISSS